MVLWALYSLVLGDPGIIFLGHGSWPSGIKLGLPITCLLGPSIPCHVRVGLTCSL